MADTWVDTRSWVVLGKGEKIGEEKTRALVVAWYERALLAERKEENRWGTEN